MITDDECGAVSAEQQRVGREIGKQIQAGNEESCWRCCRSFIVFLALCVLPLGSLPRIFRAHYVCYAVFELNSCGPKRKNFQ